MEQLRYGPQMEESLQAPRKWKMSEGAKTGTDRLIYVSEESDTTSLGRGRQGSSKWPEDQQFQVISHTVITPYSFILETMPLCVCVCVCAHAHACVLGEGQVDKGAETPANDFKPSRGDDGV